MEPHWLREARESMNLREVPGSATSPVIAGWLASLGAWWRDDATPWCGTACAAWMKACGIPRPQHWYRAKGWLDWGTPIAAPAVGCIVVFERAGGGHVGLVVGKDSAGRLMVLGGNQGDAVNIRAFETARVVGYRWPPNQDPMRMAGSLPVLASADVSTNEA